MSIETGLHCLALHFVARRGIRSLPKWHGARWHALLREASHLSGYNLEEIVFSCRPERNGERHIQEGDSLFLNLLAPASALKVFPLFLNAFAQCFAQGEFSAASLRLEKAQDAINGKIVWLPNDRIMGEVLSFRTDYLLAAAERLASLDRWTLSLTSPLRLPLPAGHPERGEERDKYARPDFLRQKEGLKWLLGKLRFMPSEEAATDRLEPLEACCSLQWEDMRYNKSRKIALGGITGQIVWRGRPRHETALRLVLGRVLGAGKNPRFGLGFWDIPELA